MDPTVEFFAKLKKLAVTLESETERLQQVFESRKSEDDTGETKQPRQCSRIGPNGSCQVLISDTTATAMRAYHEVNCDVGNLKVTYIHLIYMWLMWYFLSILRSTKQECFCGLRGRFRNSWYSRKQRRRRWIALLKNVKWWRRGSHKTCTHWRNAGKNMVIKDKKTLRNQPVSIDDLY